jgi:hypothetical protein
VKPETFDWVFPLVLGTILGVSFLALFAIVHVLLR